jgi:molybdenum cofactor synthesis domain-containing protein
MRCAGIVTISDSRSQGTRPDTTTERIRKSLVRAGFTIASEVLIPDDREAIIGALMRLSDEEKCALILTTGGTGLGPRDVTPEATQRVIDRPVPGLCEAMRSQTAQRNPLAWLSRASAGLRKRSLIVNLPGSPRAVEECLDVLLPLLPHALSMVEGKSHGHSASAVDHS